jgi:hypothetical protein
MSGPNWISGKNLDLDDRVPGAAYLIRHRYGQSENSLCGTAQALSKACCWIVELWLSAMFPVSRKGKDIRLEKDSKMVSKGAARRTRGTT